PVDARHARGLRQQRLWLGQDDAPAPLQVAEQPLAVAHADVLRLVEQLAAALQRLLVPLLLVGGAHLVVDPGALAAELADRLARLLLEAGLAAEQVIEAAGHLAGEL